MERIVVLGPGGAGKTTFAVRLGELLGIPVTELDQCFWDDALVPMPRDQWEAQQLELIAKPTWILDGDLGPYDVVDVRIRAADAVILLDSSRLRCGWRALRRSRERIDFWRWLWTWRRDYRPRLLASIAANAPGTTVHVLRNPRAVERFFSLPRADPR